MGSFKRGHTGPDHNILKQKLCILCIDFISLPICLSYHPNSMRLLNIFNNSFFKTDQLSNECAGYWFISRACRSPAISPIGDRSGAHSLAYLFLPRGHFSAEQSVTLYWTICIGRGFPGNKNWGRWGRYGLQIFYWPWNLHCLQEKLVSTRRSSFSKQTEFHLLQFKEIIAPCTIFRTIWNKNIKT